MTRPFCIVAPGEQLANVNVMAPKSGDPDSGFRVAPAANGESAGRATAAAPTERVFLLSPANTAGIRARMLFNPNASFDLAVQLRTPRGAAIGDVFSFLSGLYFRGKLAYAQAHARPPRGVAGVQVITSSRGLLLPDTPVTIEDLKEFASVAIDLDEPRYRQPLAAHARQLFSRAAKAEIILLGSVATGKYVDVFLEAFGDCLRFPAAFVGRGDMSRGGLMLRHLDADNELEYVPVAGAIRHGSRPPKLEKRR